MKQNHIVGVSAALVGCLALPLIAQVGASSGEWLDSIPQNWNRPGELVPEAPFPADAGKTCGLGNTPPDVHPAETVEERKLAAKGWGFYGKPSPKPPAPGNPNSAIIVRAFTPSGFDGMCRETSYQDFVFVGGEFAGTISPSLMWARQDGESMGSKVDGRTIVAEFKRYSGEDPLCCPSRISRAEYEIRMEKGHPLLVLTRVKSRKFQI